MRSNRQEKKPKKDAYMAGNWVSGCGHLGSDEECDNGGRGGGGRGRGGFAKSCCHLQSLFQTGENLISLGFVLRWSQNLSSTSSVMENSFLPDNSIPFDHIMISLYCEIHKINSAVWF